MSLKEFIICGYTRRIQKSLLEIFPLDIIFLLCTFYDLKDKWSKIYSNEQLEIADYNITAPTYLHGFCHVYGDIVLKPGLRFNWRFKLIGNFECVYIGIIKDDDKLLCEWRSQTSDWAWNCRGADNGFVFSCSHNNVRYLNENQYKEYKKQIYGEMCGNNGDIIEMIVDVTDVKNKIGSIKYIINGKDYGIAYDKIPTHSSYRMAVCIYRSQHLAQVQLI
eukprot:322170_1